MADATIRLGFDDSAMRSGLARATSQVQGFERKVAAVSKGGMGGGMLGGMAGLAAGAVSLGGIKSVIDEFDRIGDLSKQLNQSAEAVQRMGRMAKLSGTDLESAARALNRLNKTAAQGGAGDAFAELGLNMLEFQKADADKQLVMLATAFQRAEANGKGLAATYDLFGRSAAELLPLLRSNVGELERMSQAKVVSEDSIAKIQELNDAWDSFVMTGKAGLASFAVDAGKFGVAIKDALGGMMSGEGFNDAFRKSMEGSKAAAAVARDDAKAKREAAAAAAAAAEEKNAIAKLEADLAKEKIATATAEGAAVDKLSAARDKVREADAAAAAAAAKGDKQGELTALIAKEKATRDMASAQKAYTDEVERAAKAEAARQDSINALKDELKLSDLKARGKDKEAAALEKEMKLKAEAGRIAKETGATPQQAEAMAKKKLDDEERMQKRAAGKIIGHKREKLNDFRGLDAMRAAQNENFWEKHKRGAGLNALANLQKDKAAPVKLEAKTMEDILRQVAENTKPLTDL